MVVSAPQCRIPKVHSERGLQGPSAAVLLRLGGLQRRYKIGGGAGFFDKCDDIVEVVVERKLVGIYKCALIDIPNLAALRKQAGVAFKGTTEASCAFDKAFGRFGDALQRPLLLLVEGGCNGVMHHPAKRWSQSVRLTVLTHFEPARGEHINRHRMLDMDRLAELLTYATVCREPHEGLCSVERPCALPSRRAFLGHPAKAVVNLAEIVADRLFVTGAVGQAPQLKKRRGDWVGCLGENPLPGVDKLRALALKRCGKIVRQIIPPSPDHG